MTRTNLVSRGAGPLIAIAAVASALGCSSGETSLSTEDNLTGDHYPASNCELFVDRAAPYFSSHGLEQLTLYLKTPLDKFSMWGGVKSVGFHAQVVEDGQAGPYHDISAGKFVGADDYWSMHFDIGSDFSPRRVHRGAFYVETGDGTRLWVNAQEGGKNFVLDSAMVNNMAGHRQAGFYTSESHTGPDSALVVVDDFPYLNPGGCR